MTEKKPKKGKVQIETRAPQKRGIFDNLGKDRQRVKHPFAEIMNFPAENEDEAVNEQSVLPNIPDQHYLPNQSSITIPTNLTNPISPRRDFTKVPNSLARQAIPERFFKGMSKNTYDALYLRTRGAITPIRKIRATKSDLMRWAGVSDVTVDKHIKHLKSVGLLRVDFIIGSHEGNWYEVLIPEEINPDNQLTQPNVTNLTNPIQPNIPNKVGNEVTNLVGDAWGSETPVDAGESIPPKTLPKTNTNDDESVFNGFIKKIQSAVEEITGKKISKHDGKNLEKLADLLVLELKIAARRTDVISSVPAFLTEILRRKLRDKLAPIKNEKGKVDLVGKFTTGEYEIKPLDEKGREALLIQLQEFAGDEFLEDFKKWYTEEDWKWLMGKIKK